MSNRAGDTTAAAGSGGSQGDRRRPVLLVVSAPSGAGKTTLCKRLLRDVPTMDYSISCTTRPPRKGDVPDRSYRFLDEAEFLRLAAAGEFLELALVHGHHYGTPREPVRRSLAAGRDVLMDIDVQGAEQIRAAVRVAPPGDVLRRGHIDVFIAPPSMDELRRRLEGRGSDSRETIERRLCKAREEMDRAHEFRHVVVNDDLEAAYARLRGILRAAAAAAVDSGLAPG